MFGAFGAGAQVGAEFVAFAGGFGAELGEDPFAVGAGPVSFGAGGVLGGLGADSFLVCLACLFGGVGGGLAGLVPFGLGGADPPVGVGAGLADRRVPVCLRRLSVGAGLFHGGVTFSLGGGDARLGVLAGLVDSGVPVGLGLGGPGLGGGQQFAHLFGGGVGVGAERLGLGGPLFGGRGPGFRGGGPLFGGGPDSFDLGLGGGWVGDSGDGLPQPVGDPGDPVGLGAQLPQQLRTGDPGHGDGLFGPGGRSACFGGGQAAALPPGGDLGVAAAFAVLRGLPGPVAGAAGNSQPGNLHNELAVAAAMLVMASSPAIPFYSSILPVFVARGDTKRNET